MPNKLERFTQRARHVLGLAQGEAERFQHEHIGTEHLLLGLIREEGGVAGRVLNSLGVRYDLVSELIQQLATTPSHPLTSQPDLSAGTKKVLELAVEEARRLGHHYIGTEHLLLGIARKSDGMAVEVLRRMGITPEEIRRQTDRILQETPVQRPLTLIELPATDPADNPSDTPTGSSTDDPAAVPPAVQTNPVSALNLAPPVNRLLQYAAAEARAGQKPQVEMEHIFMALVRQYESTIGGILRILRLSPEDVRRLIQTGAAGAAPANPAVSDSASGSYDDIDDDTDDNHSPDSQ